MKKFLFAVPALALVLSACGGTYEDDYDYESEETYVPVCIDPETEERLPDDYCEQGDDDFLMTALLVYMLYSSDYPGVGHHVKHYKKTKPSGVTFAKPSKKGYVKPKANSGSGYKPKSGGSGSKPKSSGGGFKSGGGGGFKSSGGRR